MPFSLHQLENGQQVHRLDPVEFQAGKPVEIALFMKSRPR
jgi:hypothetical protein